MTRRLSKILIRAVVPVSLAAILPGAVLAEPVQLNFAAVNQSLWSSGDAIVLDGSVAIPDPAASAHLNLAAADISPTGALLDLIGLDSFGPNVTINPSGDFSAQLSAYYHVNSGSISLNYPEEVQLTLPTAVHSGETFQVGVANPGGITPFNLVSQSIGSLSNAAGAGYGLNALAPFLQANATLLTPTAGFTTVSPFAQAGIRADLSAGASIHASACFGVVVGEVCPFTGNVGLGSVDLHTQLLQLSTLTGLQVLDQPVISLSDQHIDIPGGLGSVTFNSPSLNLGSDTLRAGGVLADSGQVSFMQLALDVDQLIPLVGSILHNSVGPFGYDLLSVSPTLSLTLHQALSFEPTLFTDLHFSEPVICMTCATGSTPTRDLSLVLGQNETLMPATIGAIGGTDLQITPTYRLANVFHNSTYLTLDGSVQIEALALTAPVQEGPAFSPDPLELFSLPLYLFGDSQGTSFQLDVPSITTAAAHVSHTGNLSTLLSAEVNPLIAPNDAGHSQYTLSSFLPAAGQFSAFGFAFGQLISGPGEQYFLADSDVTSLSDGTDLGRLFCISCLNVAGASANPYVMDDSGSPVYFSDLSSFRTLPTAQDITNPDSPNYDPVLASSQYFQQVQSVAAGIVTRDTPVALPEPSAISLLVVALFMLALMRLMRDQPLGRAGNPRRLPTLAEAA